MGGWLGPEGWKCCWVLVSGPIRAAGTRGLEERGLLAAGSFVWLLGWVMDLSLRGSGLGLDVALLSRDAGDRGSGEAEMTPVGFLSCRGPQMEENFASSAVRALQGWVSWGARQPPRSLHPHPPTPGQWVLSL